MSTLIARLLDDTVPEWQDRANCTGTHTNAFYPEKGETSRPALRVCRACPVRTECLEWALARGERGIWGGTTEPERRRILRNRAKDAA